MLTRKIGNTKLVLMVLALAPVFNWATLLAAPIHDAAEKGDYAAVEKLLNSGVDVNLRHENNGSTPLQSAAFSGNKNLVALLMRRGGNINASDNDGSTALHAACITGHTSIASLLIYHGADVNARIKDEVPFVGGFSPLHSAALQDKDDQLLDLLVLSKADVNAMASNGFTPLHIAASAGNTLAMDKLLEFGAQINAADKTGSTPLHLAASTGHKSAVELLLKNGANANALTVYGYTPRDVAKTEDIAKLLTPVTSALRSGGNTNQSETGVNAFYELPVDMTDHIVNGQVVTFKVTFPEPLNNNDVFFVYINDAEVISLKVQGNYGITTFVSRIRVLLRHSKIQFAAKIKGKVYAKVLNRESKNLVNPWYPLIEPGKAEVNIRHKTKNGNMKILISEDPALLMDHRVLINSEKGEIEFNYNSLVSRNPFLALSGQYFKNDNDYKVRIERSRIPFPNKHILNQIKLYKNDLTSMLNAAKQLGRNLNTGYEKALSDNYKYVNDLINRFDAKK